MADELGTFVRNLTDAQHLASAQRLLGAPSTGLLFSSAVIGK